MLQWQYWTLFLKTNRNPLDYVKEVSNCLLFTPVSELYICCVVQSIKPKKSSGDDNIGNSLLKNIINVIKYPLCVVINKSILSGIFPDLMKRAKVVPLFKSGDRSCTDNYRPISLLPVISKVLERVVYNFTTKFLMDNKILYPRQFGFRRDHSTSDAIMNLVGDCLHAFEDKSMIMAVFIDLKKAFDTVPHSVILAKLAKLGVQNKELDWFRSYVSNRRQFTVHERCCSDDSEVTVGVQQGSLLGVLLFQILINDLPSSLRYCMSILYADDTTIYLCGKSLKFMRIKLQSDLDCLQEWLCSNGLKLNVSKTKCMLFNQEGLNPHVDLMINNQLVENVTSFKFLGVILDQTLSFELQYKAVYNKLLQSLFVLRKLSSYLPLSCLHTLYFAYFHSNLCYCTIVWFPLLKSANHEALYKLQKKSC